MSESTVDIFADDQADAPISRPPVPANGNRRGFFIGMALVAAFAVWQVRGCDVRPNPNPIPTDRPAVLFVVDESRPEDISVEQSQVTNSQVVQQWCDENDIDYRRYDVTADLSRDDPQWQSMLDAVDRPPAMVTVDGNNRGTVSDIPSGVEAALRALKDLKQ